MKNAYTSLEFEQIENNLKPFFAYQENISLFHEEEIQTSPQALEKEHGCLLEAVSYLQKGYQISLLEVQEIRPYLSLLSKDGVLSIEALSSFIPFLDNTKALYEALKDKTFLPELNNLALDMVPFSSLEERLSSAILPDLTIADDASSNLFEIRSKLRKSQDNINQALRAAAGKYSSFLSASAQETLKSGMPSLAVQAQYKNHVKGLVADISNSGGTVFIIPLEVLDIQNKVFELKEDERDEIARILKDLSSALSENLPSLLKDYEAGLRLDSLFARVKYGNTYQGNVASNGEGIILEDLSHPLLNQDTVVRNNISLGGDKARILVISGPNAGGKTVLIKAVSLACLMNQKGLLVAVRGKAVLPLFESIRFLSGDSQSIMDSLSTFSGHIASIKKALDNIDASSLLVIDEIGQGTSPSDGEALGVSIIDYLKGIGCFTILTSHYEGIKEKAFEDKDCLIGAMIFDEKTIKPTFRYQEGMIGKSYALEVSANMGLNPQIIKGAQEYLASKRQDQQSRAMDQILSLQQENLRLKEDYERKIQEQEAISVKRQRALEALNEEKEAIREKAQDKIDALILEKTQQIDLAFRSKKISLTDLAKLKGELSAISGDKQTLKAASSKVAPKQRHLLSVGDHVRVLSMNNSGIVKALDESHASASIDLGGLIIKTSPSDLVYLDSGKILSKPVYATADKYIDIKNSIPLDCNLIGLRQDEAREKMNKYLDDCLLRHLHQVTIIHGNGTGALRTMVKNELSKNKNVASFRLGVPGEGGVGVTVVSLK
jgi:DNA mismatch repair protein MutS2